MNHIATGIIGEDLAVQFLEGKQYRILERNYRVKTGEIDIIAEFKKTIVFVEVKTRRTTSYGFPAEAVTYAKQQKIIHTAAWFLNQNRYETRACRFDVVEVILSANSAACCNHIENAFGA